MKLHLVLLISLIGIGSAAFASSDCTKPIKIDGCSKTGDPHTLKCNFNTFISNDSYGNQALSNSKNTLTICNKLNTQSKLICSSPENAYEWRKGDAGIGYSCEERH